MKYRLLVGSLLLASAAPLLAQQPLLKQPGHWAQDYTGRQADPSVRFGTLPNGLRYAIMHNTTPSDGVSMRMRIGSGSLEERDDEQGLAHLLEHMAFRGSANVPDGEVVHMLERQGLQFGPDTNAFTSQDETVYMFNFPKADATALDTGLKLFREIGERLNLAQNLMDTEKGVVLSEERLRDTPQYRTVKANIGTMLDGTRAPTRWPIGQVDTIKAATHDRLERFYRANYRPDNATIVIVGNIDPAAVEAQIKARFSDWKASGTPDTIDFGTPSGKKPIGEIVGPGVPDQLSLTWVRPDDKRAETEAVDHEYLINQVALTVLNQRLSDRAMKPGAPFVGAMAAEQRSLLDAASITTIGLAASPDKWHEALDAVSAEQRMLMRDGVQPMELQRAVTTLRTQLEAKAAASSTRKSADIADAIIKTVNDGELYTSDAQDLAFSTPILAKITPAEVNGALKTLFAGSGPILFRSAQTAAVGDTRLAQALSGAYSSQLGAEVKEAAISWPYTSFGKPSPVVSKTVDAKLGTTTVKFANGTRLLVKPTKFEKDKIQVAVLFGNGRAGVAPDRAGSLWESPFFTLGGTAKMSTSDMSRWAQQTGKVTSASLAVGTRSFALVGASRPADLVVEMQTLAAYARDPGFRPEAFEKVRSIGPMIAGQIEANAGAVYSRGSQALLVGHDPRFELVPSSDDLAHIAATDLPSLFKNALSGQADVVIVGDVSVDDAIKATQGTFASGAATKPPVFDQAKVTMAAPAAEPFVFQHKGRADQAFYGEYYKLPDYFADPKTSNAAKVAAAVLETRLIDTVREKLGMTYSPQVAAESALDLQGEGYFAAAIETPPANFGSFHTLLAEQVADLAKKPVSADELERAKQPIIEGLTKKLETNGYWVGKLTELMRDPRVERQMLSEIADVSAIDAADVQAVVAKFVAGQKPLVAISRAQTADASTGAGAAAATGAHQ
jgi:zinc protease